MYKRQNAGPAFFMYATLEITSGIMDFPTIGCHCNARTLIGEPGRHG
jgi:hypothetical protein